MAFQDRPYQTEAVESIFAYFGVKDGNPLIGMPTGTGKSVVLARFLQKVFSLYPMQRVMMATHVKELIQQNYEKLITEWPFAPAGVYSAGLGEKNSNCPITFAGIQSVAKKWMLFGHIDLLLIDEAHLLSPNEQTMYRSFINGLKSVNPWLKVIGLTATPWRLGHGHLTDPAVDKDGNETPSLFTDMCFDITGLEAFNRLIAEGYLLPLIPRRTKLELSVEGLHKQMGEFKESEMQDRFDREEITEAALREAIEIAHAENRNHWLIFASGIDHAEHISDMLNSMGISAAAVHSKSSGRDEAITAFRRGDITAIVNNNVLTTGFDSPHIDLIICLRATSSTVLWVQMMGRGTRPHYAPGFDLEDMGGRLAAIEASGKQNCLVLDYARNTSRLGPINDPVLPMARGKGGGEAPVKLCEFCDTYNHISARVCCNCGKEFTFEVKFKVNASTDDIIKGELPITKVFEVDHISADVHHKMDRPPSIKVTYYCGLKAFTEYVSPEHVDWAGRKAQKWWRTRSDFPMPATTAECLEQIHLVKPATQLRVWINKKYPEIMEFCFDGTAFGTQEAVPMRPEIKARVPHNYNTHPLESLEDDDIPF